MKWLASEGKINILKIKNRLSTPLNDVMIMFTVNDFNYEPQKDIKMENEGHKQENKGSFLICEIQLILSSTNVTL